MGATNPYGRSKLKVEEILADLCASDSAWQVACLRYFNPAGAHDSGLIGEDPNGVPNNLMPFVAQVASAQRVWQRLPPTPDGTGVRDYIHVIDLAKGHLARLNYVRQHTGWHAFNLGTGQGYSVLDMVHVFEAASRRPVPYQVVARRPGDVAASYSRADKAHVLPGWRARLTLQDMCESRSRWQRKCDNPTP